ncbi:hypothetical protein Mgra_00000203 [Meloidogyne graminicola]|uniref:Uncharacterized protein n=1 Tax=Meloidogyne graminicola TaxID=189291 RepID=A0A8T0A4C2_9BILA|nr:hypothetical protein Mgra_00000203 [Meloidogyne graminicola]
MSEAKKSDSDKSQEQQPLLPSSASPPRSPDDDSKTKGKYRFEVAVLSLATMVFAVCILQSLANCEFFFVRLAVLPIALFLTFFGYEWVTYFSDALTRRRRAYFDVRNLLETYQPRRNTDLARQFKASFFFFSFKLIKYILKPDPPTPSVSNQPTTKGIRFPEEDIGGGDKGSGSKKDFASWRNEHYANEYAKAMMAGKGQTSLYEPIPGELLGGGDISITKSNENTTNRVIPADSIEQMKEKIGEKNIVVMEGGGKEEGGGIGDKEKKEMAAKEEVKDKKKQEEGNPSPNK